MIRTSRAVLGALLALAASSVAAVAQTPRTPAGRVTVTVAVTDSTNFGQDVVILRRPDSPIPNLILMARSAATPARLAAAAATLFVIMQRNGDRPTRRALYRISTKMTGPARAIGPARKALARLDRRGAPTLDVKGVAAIGTTRIYLPDRTARASRAGRAAFQLRAEREADGGR